MGYPEKSQGREAQKEYEVKLSPLANALRDAVRAEIAGCGLATSAIHWNLVAEIATRLAQPQPDVQSSQPGESR